MRIRFFMEILNTIRFTIKQIWILPQKDRLLNTVLMESTITI